jgi:superfamily II DNA or RNA helicase
MGLREELVEKCEWAGIVWEEEDIRVHGRKIKAELNGQLKENQTVVAERMLTYGTGILSAVTAFEKTVVCSYLIGARIVNTLILLKSSFLIDQWQEALAKFLIIDEELLEYQIPSG